ncbi:D-amino-acid dehydrogenase [Paracoccus alcaliphilus]|uniref:D-amino-acid dehydrogenase n=1 Tax=Paracoccus alcaliphilus TaxID=34002 RepID=A0A1H8NZW9_9RHOB|nr:FAD-binding oxidoreductase [Paracoccus alcaliphilus]WCR21075.1 FAD-binding oxidoreductase [Paracoccus alcaliphilus]SEO35147.1 D-amino-acid dehydrogenase [Paracoccus alcaliphilus]
MSSGKIAPGAGLVAVIGAGLVGLACARRLQRDGFDVALFDPGKPGAGASYGNAGLIAGSAVIPEASMETLCKLPGLLFGSTGPLSLKPSYLPRMAPFLWHFAKACRISQFDRISRAMAGLSLVGFDHWMTLLDDLPDARALFQRNGCLYIYLTDAERRAAEAHNEVRRARGMSLTDLSASEVANLVPSLARPVAGAMLAHEAGHVLGPGALSQALFDRFMADGGQFINAPVSEIIKSGNRVSQLRTASGQTYEVGHVVLAAGAHSSGLAAQLNCGAPIVGHRGYHLMIAQPGVETQLPMLVPALGIAVTPMQSGLRFAGLVEFADFDAPPSEKLFHQIQTAAKRLFPQLQVGASDRWMGCRPSLPDGVPILDRAPGLSNALLAFGHGQMGLTQAAVSGHVISDLMLGKPPRVDITPYGADRFSRHRSVADVA